MSENTPPREVADEVVVSMDYVLTVDGEEVDSSEDTGPIDFLQGFGNIIPGLEDAIYGMKIGESKAVIVEPEDGYGEYDDEMVEILPKLEFPREIPLEIGVELDMKDEDDEVVSARIIEVAADDVTLDFNHPLAGMTLNFNVTIVSLRNPTEEELEHGHAHGMIED